MRLALLLALCIPSFAVTTRYVDTASTAGGDCTTAATAGANRACATLAAAAALISKPMTDAWVIHCASGGGAADTAAVSISGHTTTSSNTITITGNSGGVWDTSKYVLAVASADVLTLGEGHIMLGNLQLSLSSPSGNNQHVLYSWAATNPINAYNLLIRGSGGATYYEIGIEANGTSPINLWNSAIYGASGNISGSVGFLITGAATVNIYSSVIINGRVGIRRNAGTVTCKNSYASGPGNAAFVGTVAQTNCASRDASASTVALRSIALDTDHFTNVTAGSEDFRLVNVAGHAELLAADGATGGVNTSGDSAPLNFTVDITGAARQAGSYWDIGPFYFATSTARRRVAAIQ